MSLAIEDFCFGLRANWITAASRCFRPPSWPPPRDWVVSETKDGRIISCWGDPIWDLSHIAGKPLTLNFGDGALKFTLPIDSANADLLRLIITWTLWGHHPVKSASHLVQTFQQIRPIIALCSREGVLASDLMRFPRIFEQVPGVISPSVYSNTISRLHRLLDAQESIGFILVDAEGIMRLAAVTPDHVTVQTPYIPPRIWTYQVTRLRECLDDYLKHQQAIDDCFNFCLDAYTKNYGSLSNALANPISGRQPFQHPKRPSAGSKSNCVFYGPFHQTAEQFGIEKLLQKWLECRNNRVELRQLRTYLTLIQRVGLAYIANFTLQRIDEVVNLRVDCLHFENDEKLGRIPIICGETTKTIQDSDARWPTSPSVEVAVMALRHVANLRMRCINENPLVSYSANESKTPYLFIRSFEPWSTRPKVQKSSLKILPGTYIGVFKRKHPKFFDTKELTITDDDLRVAKMLTPNLPDDEFAVGRVWPLAWHQLRRTGGVNMFASGMLSDSSMQYLMKHSSRLMPLYYGRGYTKLHLNEEVESLVTTSMYEVMAKSLLNAMGGRFVSPHSAEQKRNIVVNLIGDKDAKELAKAARRGDVFYRETRLGACTSRTLCSYGGIESVARCAGGDGHKACADVLYDRANAPKIERDLGKVNRELAHWPVGSPRHNALLMERKGLENFLDVVRS